MSNHQERRAYEIAVAAGIMPADVEDALRDARQAEQRLPSALDMEADGEVTGGDIERARAWWMFNAPSEYVRLLSAVERA